MKWTGPTLADMVNDLKNAPVEDYGWGILVFFGALAVLWLHFVYSS